MSAIRPDGRILRPRCISSAHHALRSFYSFPHLINAKLFFPLIFRPTFHKNLEYRAYNIESDIWIRALATPSRSLDSNVSRDYFFSPFSHIGAKDDASSRRRIRRLIITRFAKSSSSGEGSRRTLSLSPGKVAVGMRLYASTGPPPSAENRQAQFHLMKVAAKCGTGGNF